MARRRSNSRQSAAVATRPQSSTAVATQEPRRKDLALGGWGVLGVVGPSGEMTHVLFGANPWASVVLTACTGAVTYATWTYSSERSVKMQRHATATAFGAGAWLTAATIAGPLTPVVGGAWLLVGGTTVITWMIKHALRNTGREQPPAGDANESLLAQVGLAGAMVRNAKVEPNKVTVDIEVPRGEMDSSDVVAARPRLASATAAPPNGVRVTPDADDAARASVVIVPVDVLKRPPTYDGPSAPGATMVEPLVTGKYEDNEPQLLYGAADPKAGRVLSHVKISGMTGSGKTIGGRVAFAEIVTRREVVIWMVDTGKRKQSFGCAASAMDWFVTDRAEALELIECLTPVHDARVDYLAERGLDNWVPGCGLSYMVIWFEEAADVLADDEVVAQVANKIRSSGMQLFISTQRFVYDKIPTSLRGALGTSWAFGAESDADARLVLNDDVMEAGARPDLWQNHKPGYNYLTGPGIPVERHTMAARTTDHFNDPAVLSAHCAEYAYLREPLDPISAGATSEAYARRTRHQPVVVQAAPTVTDRVPVDAPAATPVDAGDAPLTTVRTTAVLTADDVAGMTPEDRAKLAAAMPTLETDDPELLEHILANLDADMPPAPDDGVMATVDQVEEMTKAEAEDLVNRALADRYADPSRRRVTTDELVDLGAQTGRGRAWIHGHINELMGKSAIERVGRGVYEVQPKIADLVPVLA